MKKTTLMMLILFTMTLQGQNKLLSSIEEYYDGSTWENIQGSNYEYDSHNNLIIQTYFSWNLDWEISMKVNYTYNVTIKSQKIYTNFGIQHLTNSKISQKTPIRIQAENLQKQ